MASRSGNRLGISETARRKLNVITRLPRFVPNAIELTIEMAGIVCRVLLSRMDAKEICDAVVIGEMSVSHGSKELQKIGYSADLARNTLFIMLGGDDVIMTDANGIQRYLHSGKTVKEVARLMEAVD